MKALFDSVSQACSKLVTKSYSTSFSLGIQFLDKKFHLPIYSIYGFVRFADEIVDTFHDFDKKELLDQFRKDTYEAIEKGISLNPILQSFQMVVNEYKIERELIDHFLYSMEMDIEQKEHDRASYEKYILGSAEVVGLMCLRVFVEGDAPYYDELKPPAMALGSAFQKVNFLRDLKNDAEHLGRTYFPNVEDLSEFSLNEKQDIEIEIEKEFDYALEGIRKLPIGARRGVYVAYVFYRSLFNKIRELPAEKVKKERVRIPNSSKFTLMLKSVVKEQLNYI